MSAVTITVTTTNETNGHIKGVKVSVGGELIDDLTGLAKGETSLPNQYSGPADDLSWKVSFTDDDGSEKHGSVDASATEADHKAKVVLGDDSFSVHKSSGNVTGSYS